MYKKCNVFLKYVEIKACFTSLFIMAILLTILFPFDNSNLLDTN